MSKKSELHPKSFFPESKKMRESRNRTVELASYIVNQETITELWASQRMEIDDLRLKIFSNMPLQAQREIIRQVRDEIEASTSASQPGPKAIII